MVSASSLEIHPLSYSNLIGRKVPSEMCKEMPPCCVSGNSHGKLRLHIRVNIMMSLFGIIMLMGAIVTYIFICRVV